MLAIFISAKFGHGSRCVSETISFAALLWIKAQILLMPAGHRDTGVSPCAGVFMEEDYGLHILLAWPCPVGFGQHVLQLQSAHSQHVSDRLSTVPSHIIFWDRPRDLV